MELSDQRRPIKLVPERHLTDDGETKSHHEDSDGPDSSEFDSLRRNYDQAVECIRLCESVINELQEKLASSDELIASRDERIAGLEEKIVAMSLELASYKASEDEQCSARRASAFEVARSPSDGNLSESCGDFSLSAGDLISSRPLTARCRKSVKAEDVDPNDGKDCREKDGVWGASGTFHYFHEERREERRERVDNLKNSRIMWNEESLSTLGLGWKDEAAKMMPGFEYQVRLNDDLRNKAPKEDSSSTSARRPEEKAEKAHSVATLGFRPPAMLGALKAANLHSTFGLKPVRRDELKGEALAEDSLASVPAINMSRAKARGVRALPRPRNVPYWWKDSVSRISSGRIRSVMEDSDDTCEEGLEASIQFPEC